MTKSKCVVSLDDYFAMVRNPADLTSEVSHATLKRTRKKGHIKRNINTGDGQGYGCHSDFARKIVRNRDP